MTVPAPARGPARILCSFAYFKDWDLDDLADKLTEDGAPPSMIADSGAFSAHTMGWQVEPVEYAAWLDKWRHLFDYAITLDVIGDVEGSWRSHRHLQNVLGRDLVPVVHYGAPIDVFDRYRAEGHDVIAIGGLALKERASRGVRYRWLIDVFRWGEQTDTRFHGLGVGSFKQIYELPWWAVDSSSWGSVHRYGRSWLFDHERGKMINMNRSTMDAHHDRSARLLRDLDVDPCHLSGDTFSRYWAGAVSADAYRRAETWIREKRGVIDPPPTGRGVQVTPGEGLRLYLVDGNPAILGSAPTGLRGLRVYLAETESHNATMIVGATDAPGRGGLEKKWTPPSQS